MQLQRVQNAPQPGPSADFVPPPTTIPERTAVDTFDGGRQSDWRQRVARVPATPAPAKPEEPFSMRRALGHIGRGFKDSFKGIVTTMKERPVMCVGIIGALVGATLLWPAAMGVIIPGIQVVNSSIKAGRSIYKSVKAPDPRAAEAALAGVGDGIAGMALLGAGMAVGRVLRMFRNAGLIHLVDDAPPLLDLVKDLLNRKK